MDATCSIDPIGAVTAVVARQEIKKEFTLMVLFCKYAVFCQKSSYFGNNVDHAFFIQLHICYFRPPIRVSCTLISPCLCSKLCRISRFVFLAHLK